jgi:hypothetical protein
MFIFGGGSQSYQIKKSLRFRAAASAYLSKTFAGASDDSLKFTYSVWIKRGDLADGTLLGGNTGTAAFTILYFLSDTISFRIRNSSSVLLCVVSTPAVLRDPAAWYHVVFVFDSAAATGALRTRIYINGVEQVLTLTTSCPLNQAPTGNFDTIKRIGNFRTTSDTTHYDGYMAEVNFVDGQALGASSFGKTDAATGAWVPTKYAGTYGTNGFYLPFSDGTSLATLGNDESGNNNDWTLNNLSITSGITYDWMGDTPTNNFATLNPVYFAGTQSNASLTHASASTSTNSRSTIAMRSGKWYWEGTAGSANVAYGIGDSNLLQTEYPLTTADAWMYAGVNGNKYNGSAVAYGATFTTSDIIGIAFDADAGALEFFKNGVSQGVAFTGLVSKDYFAVVSGTTAGAITAHINFGQRPFAYTPPTGFKALCTKNLPVPTAKKGVRYFNAKTRTGTGAAYSVTGELFQPDIVWTKSRSGTTDHALYDSVRGATKQLEPNTTVAESTEAQGVTAFNADGYSGGTLAQINTNAATYVDWMWKRSVTSGLDIVTYTGTGANRTVAHNLGVVPKAIIVRSRTGATRNWAVYHAENTAAPETDYLLLDSNAATTDLNTYWNDTAPTSSDFSVGTVDRVNANGEDYVAYVFAEVSGFSKFGSYTGNASADGPFVWCGFRPRAIIFKCTTTGALSWMMQDTARSDANVVQKYFSADLTAAESDSSVGAVDFLSNGFKLRTTNGNWNNSGGTYVFLAFAEIPFRYANAR